MFGRRPRLPIDLIFPTARREVITKDIDEYVTTLRQIEGSCQQGQAKR